MLLVSEKATRWRESNLKLKLREVELLVKYFGKDHHFENVLEVGAGNCSQSEFLYKLASNSLFSIDLNSERLFSGNNLKSQTLLVADAEQLDQVDFPIQFDLVFSSNVLEHLPNVKDCLDTSLLVSNENSFYVHILPNPTWRLFSTLLYYPIKLRNLIGRLFSKKEVAAKSSWGNNMKIDVAKPSFLSRLLPPVHGVSNNLFQEFKAFRRSAWIRIFEECGYEVVDVLPGPISTGYGIGFDSLKPLLEGMGLSTEYIYILNRAKNVSEI